MRPNAQKPELKKDGLQFFPIPEFGAPEVAFGAGEENYFPRYSLPEVPEKYKSMANALMFKGGELPKFQKTIDRSKAYRYTQAMLSSFAPAHEAKIATVAYAFWVWAEGRLK